MLGVGLVGRAAEQTAFGWRRAQSRKQQHANGAILELPRARYRVAAMTIMGLVAGIAGLMELAFLQSGSQRRGRAGFRRLGHHRRHGAGGPAVRWRAESWARC